jgi:hypothetical protein
MFAEQERTLLEHGPFRVSLFRYPTGVAALRLANDAGEVVMLPYQGQQIWSAHFLGRELTMRSMFDAPKPTRTYLENYGGFLLHCGITAMGVPTEQDTHPLHGELPNAPFDDAFIILGEDENGRYAGIGGRYRHTVAFSHNYLAEPLLKLYEGSGIMRLSLDVTNLKRTDMPYMYLAHINYRPVDQGTLEYSAHVDPRHVRVRRSIPSHVTPGAGYVSFLETLERSPERHHVLEPGLQFDPEVVFFIDYLHDAAGWAHSLQVHPDGSADYVAHKPEALPKGIRWICRTPDQDALGLVLPATAEPEGFAAEQAKGNIKTLAPGARFHCDIAMGALTPEETARIRETIRAIREGSGA